MQTLPVTGWKTWVLRWRGMLLILFLSPDLKLLNAI